MLGIGPLSGGGGKEELIRVGAFRVFRGAADLHHYLDVLAERPEAARSGILAQLPRRLDKIRELLALPVAACHWLGPMRRT
jgi:hypothetical protein